MFVPVATRSYLSGTLSILACIVVLTASCGKKAAEPAPPVAAAKATAVAPVPVLELGLPPANYVAARLLQQCALKHGETDLRAEQLAIDLLQDKKPVVNLDLALEPLPPVVPPPLPAEPPAATTGTMAATPAAIDGVVEDAASSQLRARFRKAHEIAPVLGLTPQIDALIATCLYARELGLIEPGLVERYARTFVEVACLQAELKGPDGKPDVNAHAHAAAKLFTGNGFKAAEFSRLGLIFARFPQVQARIYSEKSARCPDPRLGLAAAAATAAYNGQVTGGRNGALAVTAKDGALTGSVQWLGANAKAADGAAEPAAVALDGAIAGQTVNLFGQVGYDWVRLEGKAVGTGFAGGWKAERNMQKLKGNWTMERVMPAPSAPAPAATTP